MNNSNHNNSNHNNSNHNHNPINNSNSNSNSNNNNNNSNSNHQLSILFYKVYHNIYLNRLILKYIRLYNIFSSVRVFESIESLNSFRFKEYLLHVKFKITNSNQLDTLKRDLPTNIQSLDLYYEIPHRSTKANYTTVYILGHIQPNIITLDIPYWIKSLKLEDYLSVRNHYVFSNLNSIQLTSIGSQFSEILPNSLPGSLKELVVNGISKIIKANTLPANLSTLYISFNDDILMGSDDGYDMDGMDEMEETDSRVLIEKGSLPNTLTHLTIDGSFNYKLDKGTLPSSLKNLIISDKCNKELYEHYFPDSITSLDIRIKMLNIQLPIGLKRLVIYIENNLLPNYQLPPSIEYLHIDTKSINHRNISTSSNSLLDLEFGYSFDAPLIDEYGVSIIAKSIRSIEFGFFFNQKFDSPLIFQGCNHLKTLKFGLGFNQRIAPNILPETITYISFKNYDNDGFSLVEDGFRFPSKLEYIDFGILFDQSIGGVFSNCSNLKTIIFGSAFKHQIEDNSIPSSVSFIQFSNSNYQYSFKLYNPINNVVMLKIFKNVILHSPFKEMITSIEYSSNGYFENINEAHFQSFPSTLNHLKLPFDFNEPIGKLSLSDKSKLNYLEFDHSFNQPLLIQDLPVFNSIKVLVLGEDYNQHLYLENFKNLQVLKCYGSPKLITTKSNHYSKSSMDQQDQNQFNKHYSMEDTGLCGDTSEDIQSKSDSSIEFSDSESDGDSDSESENEEDYLFYSLQVIKTPVNNHRFLDSLNPIYFKFIQLIESFKV